MERERRRTLRERPSQQCAAAWQERALGARHGDHAHRRTTPHPTEPARGERNELALTRETSHDEQQGEEQRRRGKQQAVHDVRSPGGRGAVTVIERPLPRRQAPTVDSTIQRDSAMTATMMPLLE